MQWNKLFITSTTLDKMKNSKNIIITLSVSLGLLLGIIIGKSYFSSKSIEEQKQLAYEKEYKRISDQQEKASHRAMEQAVHNLNKTR